MTGAGYAYGEALYSLAREEMLAKDILEELRVLQDGFSEEPDFFRLMDSPNLSKEERCAVLDNCFRGKVHGYVLNFLKLLVEKGHILRFSECVFRFQELYYEDNQILPVCATTAVALTAEQTDRLTDKLRGITGKQVILTNRVDPAVMGGVCLDYDGKRLDDTVSHRLGEVRTLLANTVL